MANFNHAFQLENVEQTSKKSGMNNKKAKLSKNISGV